MTKNEIIFNYNQAIKQANKLDRLADKIEKLSSEKLETTVGHLKTAWQSDNSIQYYRKVGKVQSDITKTAKDIKKIADSIRTTAEAVKSAELKALEIAQVRAYVR